MSKQLKDLMSMHPDKVGDAYIDSDGVWIHLRNGWRCDYDLHTIHEDTVKAALLTFRCSVEPCDCEDCKACLTHRSESCN